MKKNVSLLSAIIAPVLAIIAMSFMGQYLGNKNSYSSNNSSNSYTESNYSDYSPLGKYSYSYNKIVGNGNYYSDNGTGNNMQVEASNPLANYMNSYATIFSSYRQNTNNQNNFTNQRNEQQEKVKRLEGPLQPPFSIIAVKEKITDSNRYGRREYYDIHVNKNGTYSADFWTEDKDNRNGGEWYSLEADKRHYEGKWTVRHREIGEDFQKVYDLHLKSGNTFLYIPDDGEYFWDNISTYFSSADWEDCKNLNFNTAVKIAEYKTDNGTTILIPEDQRITMSTPKTYTKEDIIKYPYQCTIEKDGKTEIYILDFTDTEVLWRNTNGEIVGKGGNWSIRKGSGDVYIKECFPFLDPGKISDDGKTIKFKKTWDYHGKEAEFIQLTEDLNYQSSNITDD